MTNHVIEEYLDEVRTHLQMPAEERDAVIDEMRLHLLDKMEQLRKAEPDRSEDELALQATHSFGEPAEIGARGPGASLPPSSPMQSFWRKTTKVAVIAAGVGILLVASLILADIGAQTFGLVDHGTEANWTVYTRSNRLADQTSIENDTFFVPYAAQEVLLWITISPSANNTGCGGLILRDPNAQTVLDDSQNCGRVDRYLRFETAGRWQIDYKFQDFTGNVTVSVHAVRG